MYKPILVGKVNPKSEVIKMSKGESSLVIIKNEPCSSDVHHINDKVKVEKYFLGEAKPKVNLDYIKEDMKEEFLMEVEQEEIIIKDEISSSSDTQNDLPDDNVFPVATEPSPTSLDTETNSSTKEMRFACTLCQYKTSRKQDIKQHISHHTAASNAKFQCAKCKYGTFRKRNLVQHMVAHTGERRFACNLCEFKTAQKSNLKSHIMTHTGEKPFACTLCVFKTTSSSTLTIHKRIHTGEKPFACNLCGKFKSARKSDLNRHMMTHIGENPFACTLCEFKTFKKNRKNILKNHYDEAHNLKTIPCNI